jgi:hypothetical protein
VISADAPRDESTVAFEEDGDRKMSNLPRSFRLLAHQNNQRQLTDYLAFRSHTPPASFTGTRRETQRRAERQIYQTKMHAVLKCASLSRVPSLGASRVMLQGVSRRARVAAAELAGTRGDRKMCRETEPGIDEDVAWRKPHLHHCFRLSARRLSSSPRVPLEFGASPARSRRRLARSTAKRRKCQQVNKMSVW